MKFEFAQSRCSECRKSRRCGPIMLSTSEYIPLCSPLFFWVSFSFSFSFFSSIPPRSNCGMPPKGVIAFFFLRYLAHHLSRQKVMVQSKMGPSKIVSHGRDCQNWIADPANRKCDAPGSWYCVGGQLRISGGPSFKGP